MNPIRFASSLAAVEEDTAVALARCAARSGKTLIVHSLYARTSSEPLRILREAGITVVESLEVACRCIAASSQRGKQVDKSAPIIVRGCLLRGGAHSLNNCYLTVTHVSRIKTPTVARGFDAASV